MKYLVFLALVVVALIILGSAGVVGAADDKAREGATAEKIVRGRYMVLVGGCNDCHTDGYMAVEGKMAEDKWLTGASVGFKGPWGVTYPINLRRMVTNFTEDEWVLQVKTVKAAPPMPWWALHEMSDYDLRSLYTFLRFLGPAGTEAHSAIPPGVEPTTPYVVFEPVFPKGMASGN